MPNPDREGPFAGSRCLVAHEGGWSLSEIKRVNEDGTFNVAAVNSRLFFLNVTYGVTAAELLFNDRDSWPACFEKMATDPAGLSVSDFIEALARARYETQPEVVSGFWNTYCRDQLKLQKPDNARLDSDAAYALIVAARISATRLLQDGTAHDALKYRGAYYNAIRMGGRDPAEVAREVTLQDALEAWGVDGRSADPERLKVIGEMERRKSVALPPPLRTFLGCDGIEEVIATQHPLNPWLFPLDDLTVRPAALGLDGKYALGVFRREQFHYYAVFNETDTDARVYLLNTEQLTASEDDDFDDDDDDDDEVSDGDDNDNFDNDAALGMDEDAGASAMAIRDANRYRLAIKKPSAWRLTAPTIGMFFWDLAQTSLIWYQGNYENLQFPRTDIGLKLTDAQREIIARERSRALKELGAGGEQ